MSLFWIGLTIGAGGLLLVELVAVLWLLRDDGRWLVVGKRPPPVLELPPPKRLRVVSVQSIYPQPREKQ